MANWDFLNKARTQHPLYPFMGPDAGFCGCFEFAIPGVPQRIRCIASDGMGWQHVSVTLLGGKTPSWDLMCKIKDLFWNDEDCVVQFHPPKSQYVNHHPGCLHLWRSVDKEQPMPDKIMV